MKERLVTCNEEDTDGNRIGLALVNSPTPKTPDRRKHLTDISYTSRVIADFVPNFVAMATGVIRG